MDGPNANTLNSLWIGKNVRTEDPSFFNCGRKKGEVLPCDDHCVCAPDNLFGAEGVVIGFREEGGEVWIDLDWGYSLVITSETKITARPSPRSVCFEP